MDRRIVQYNNMPKRSSLNTPKYNATNTMGSRPSYDSLMSHYIKCQEELRLTKHVNVELDNNLTEMAKLVENMQNDNAMQLLTLAKTDDNSRKLAKLEEDSISYRKTITNLTEEKKDLIAKHKDAEDTIKQQKDDIKHNKKLIKTEKYIAAEQIDLLEDSEKTIGMLEKTMTLLSDENKSLKNSIEKKDTLLNMQRQQIDEQTDRIQMYDRRFLRKNMTVPKMIARADEADRMWAKIEEREKKDADHEHTINVLREENQTLKDDKERLEQEVEEVKTCFKTFECKTENGDRVEMAGVLGWLRETVQLKEKVQELEQMLSNKGYTIKATKAENDYKKKEMEKEAEIETLTKVIKMLKDQTDGEDNLELPVLLGKLEETLHVFGVKYVPTDDKLDDISACQSDIMSLNSTDSYKNDACCTTRDFKDLMDPKHYTVMSRLIDGVGSMAQEGLCTSGAVGEEDEDIEDEEGRDDIVSVLSPDIFSVMSPREEGDGDDDCSQADEDEEEQAVDTEDIHMKKVLDILAQDEESVSSIRVWGDEEESSIRVWAGDDSSRSAAASE